MKLSIYCPIILCTILFTGCSSSNQGDEDPAHWTEDQVSDWFDSGEWLGQSPMRPDPSIDRREFAVHYHQNKARWDKAFAFLAKEDLQTLEAGNHQLDGDNVFVKVTEYNSKNPEDVSYENHQNYADIQFVVSGMEYIGRTDLSQTTVLTPYDKEKDIQFYKVATSEKLLAKPGTFFIFFHDDAHCPGLKVNDNAPVKKMVIKVKN